MPPLHQGQAALRCFATCDALGRAACVTWLIGDEQSVQDDGGQERTPSGKRGWVKCGVQCPSIGKVGPEVTGVHADRGRRELPGQDGPIEGKGDAVSLIGWMVMTGVLEVRGAHGRKRS